MATPDNRLVLGDPRTRAVLSRLLAAPSAGNRWSGDYEIQNPGWLDMQQLPGRFYENPENQVQPAQYAGPGATARVGKGLTPALQAKITEVANNLGISPLDLATAIAYETIGTFSPAKIGGAGNRYAGLIQFGPHERKVYGVTTTQDAVQQMDAVEAYLRDRGLKPGMGLVDIYSTINAGRPGKYGAKDASGKTVKQHVAEMQASYGPVVKTAFEAESVPTPRLRPTREARAKDDTVAPVATPATMVDKAPPAQTGVTTAQAGTLTPLDMNVTAASRPDTQTQPTPYTGTPFTPNADPADWAEFQQRLAAGQVPWSDLPEAWRATIAEKVGPDAEAAYNTATNQVRSTAAVPTPRLRPDVKPPVTEALAFSPDTAASPTPAVKAVTEMATAAPPVASLPISQPIVEDTPAPAVPDQRAPVVAAEEARVTPEPPTPRMRTAAVASPITPPQTAEVAKTANAAQVAPPTPAMRPGAAPPVDAAATWKRLAPAVGGLLGKIAKVLIPGASAISRGMPVSGVPGVSTISGPGPFNKGSAGSYLNAQSWRAPDYNPVSGGSKYSYFVDSANGIGGYRTQDGRTYTYSL